MLSQKTLAYLAQHTAALCIGFTGIIGKLVNQNALLLVFFRTFFAFLGLLLLFGVNKKFFVTASLKTTLKQKTFWLKHFKLLLLSLLLVLHWVSFFVAVQKSGAALGTLAYSTFPLFLTIIEPLFLKSNFSWNKSLICFFITLGIYFLVPEISWQNNLFVGICWGVFSGLMMAVIILFSGNLSRQFSTKTITLFSNFYASLILLPFVIALLPWLFSWQDWLWLLFLGLVCTALAHSLFIFAVKTLPAQIFGVILSLEAVYTLIFSYLFLDERLSLRSIFGAFIIIISFVAFQLQKQKPVTLI